MEYDIRLKGDRRKNLHMQMLVDVGILLRRFTSCVYTRSYLEEVLAPEAVIVRVLAQDTVRPGMHLVRPVSGTTEARARTVASLKPLAAKRRAEPDI